MDYVFGDCELDTCLYTLQRGGQTIRLRPKVFRVCLYLLEHRDRVVSREELCAQVWSGQFISQTTLEGVIRAVRKAVGDSGQSQGIIQTLYGYGYRFVAVVEERPTKIAGRVVSPALGVLIAEGASTRTQTAGVTDSVASAPAPDATPLPVWSGEPSCDTAFEDEYGADSRAGIAPGEQRTASLGSLWRLARGRVGHVLAVLILSLLGAWGLWQGMKEGEVVPLDKSRIAVLPFLNLSAEADRTYFADGITEELIAQLSQIHGLTVIARTSVMKYKGTLKDVATIGRELRVGMILEGSVRTVDNQMRINAQLIDVASQGHLWSQEYDRELTDSFGIQGDIATRVAQQLKVQLTAGGKPRIEEQETGHLDAYKIARPLDADHMD
jgi:TolB-like protein/DNA-binding winged helix-turn-helix (wHTH) protein